MKRDYETGEANDIIFFTGVEVEKTPAFGMKTLFVTGVQDISAIEHHYVLQGCEHIFFGANHSFKPGVDFPKDADAWDEWEDMIRYFLDKNILCSLDLPLSHAEALL